MAGTLTDTGENRALDWLTQNSTTAPTSTLKCRLMTVDGSDASAGTEVTGGTYASQTVTFGAASAGATSNAGTLSFTGMPACTVTGAEIWDSAGTPIRWWAGSLTTSRAVLAGDTFEIAAGALTLSLA